MMRTFCIFISLTVAALSTIFAQSSVESGGAEIPKNAVSIVPQYAAISGIRIDYERRMKGDNWLLFAPQLFVNQTGNNDYDQMTGFGMNLYYKLFLSRSKKKNATGFSRTNIYFSAGPAYQYFSLTNLEEVPETFTENGITYIGYTSGEVTTRINKFGANADFGLQFAFERFILDLYGGVGIRYAVDQNGHLMDRYDNGWLNFGYSGILLDGGVRFGFFIN